jgi:hypothetical protein
MILLSRRNKNFAQESSDSDSNVKTNTSVLYPFALFALSNATYANGTVINIT